MSQITALLDMPPYSLRHAEKSALLLEQLKQLLQHQQKSCEPFARISKKFFAPTEQAKNLTELPYLMVGLFKEQQLKSIADSEVFKVLTSSGTTSQQVSRIYLDQTTAQLQTKALMRIMTHWLGPQRLPMLIVDDANVIKDRQSFSARGAGILGMMNFGTQHQYLLQQEQEALAWLQRHQGQPMLIFGFTFMVWEYLVEKKYSLDLSQAILIHSGGWKKLADRQVDNATFKKTLAKEFGLKRVHNFYGMVEQVGSVFVECEAGHFHCPNFADLVIRDSNTLAEISNGNSGVVQVFSLLPQSYPGQSILTEDLGTVHGIDDCNCGRLGKHFTIQGRVAKVEMRGCSDTFSSTTVTPT